jgi:hypothetical protein
MLKWLTLLCVLPVVVSTRALAQDAPVTNCDTYGGSEQDPQRKTAGMPFDLLNPAVAIPSCEAAAGEYPNSNRFAFQLGRAYLKANNFEQAVASLHKAAEQGYAAAQKYLGLIYENGQGVQKDDAQSFVWYQKAAEQGDAPSQFKLGMMYESGKGVEKEDAQAVTWYRKAAEQGNIFAQLELGRMYEDGQGVEKDDAQALAWYRKVAEQAYSEVQTKVVAATTAASVQQALTVTLGRLVSSSGFVKQNISVKNGTVNMVREVKVECGFFNRDQLIATDDTYVENIAPGTTGYKTLMVMSDINADRTDCRIVEGR